MGDIGIGRSDLGPRTSLTPNATESSDPGTAGTAGRASRTQTPATESDPEVCGGRTPVAKETKDGETLYMCPATIIETR
jgi:hypothetical protein